MDVEEFLKRDVNRRQFLDRSARNAAGMAAGVVGLASNVSLAESSPNERVVLAGIGVRGQGKFLTSSMAGFSDVRFKTICDVDESVIPAAMKSIEKAQGVGPNFVTDFRHVLDDPEIDGVVIATPDHWHALMAIMACQAGKDVYVEKPVSHNFNEGMKIIEAGRKHQRVIQSGIHQRSGAHFQSAVDFVRSGKLGNVKLAKAWMIHRRKPIGKKKNASIPTGVNYDLWLGPAAKRPFNPNRFHYNWHWFWDYGTGEMGNWGVHMLDIARWGLGVELPEKISASGGKYFFDDDQETPDTQTVQFSYADKTLLWEHRLWSVHGMEGRNAAAAFYGDRGTLVVDRGGWKVYDQKEAATSGTSDQAVTHHRNFVDCIKTRNRPTSDIEIGHTSSALCHLGNIAYRVGREIHFDKKQACFVNDEQANGFLGREYRQNWELPQI
ncbi:Glucose--fructose oxidoreductase precursor [Gimesia aquarii]|uniref:Glucose--fructose oxidoreductase n=1 Tax=Gimesia aquarii TaxID=2527964 RepID=A0A517X2Q0_9PLAN|nr:Glucose--fructose oxidoreductase precursor [Gimesia aquarii]